MYGENRIPLKRGMSLITRKWKCQTAIESSSCHSSGRGYAISGRCRAGCLSRWKQFPAIWTANLPHRYVKQVGGCPDECHEPDNAIAAPLPEMMYIRICLYLYSRGSALPPRSPDQSSPGTLPQNYHGSPFADQPQRPGCKTTSLPGRIPPRGR